MKKNLMFNSYETMQQLVAKKLATVKTDGKFDTFKYHRNVMYDNLWQKYPELLEVRGHVYDNRNGRLVQAAPRKTFNYLENDTWKNVPLDTPVQVFKKLNGFLACATEYEGELVVSTTGTTNSEYAVWAKELIQIWYENPKNKISCASQGFTDVFEIVVPQDPHIVEEQEGCHWLGYRNKTHGKFTPSNWLRPTNNKGEYIECTLARAIELAQSDRGEGFMLYDAAGNCCKLKTPYYVGKKILMRMTEKNVHAMYMGLLPARLPEMWYDAVNAVKKTYKVEDWIAMQAQTRRKVLEQYV